MRNLLKKYRISKLKKNIYVNNPSTKGVLIESDEITYVERITIGSFSRIGPNMIINAEGKLNIGSNVIFGPNCVIWTVNHNYYNSTKLPYDDVKVCKEVRVGNNCWLGEGVKLAPGVSIGEGCIVAMGSVVLSDIPSFSIVAGNPAKVIKVRNDLNNYKGLDVYVNSYLRSKYERL